MTSFQERDKRLAELYAEADELGVDDKTCKRIKAMLKSAYQRGRYSHG